MPIRFTRHRHPSAVLAIAVCFLTACGDGDSTARQPQLPGDDAADGSDTKPPPDGGGEPIPVDESPDPGDAGLSPDDDGPEPELTQPQPLTGDWTLMHVSGPMYFRPPTALKVRSESDYAFIAIRYDAKDGTAPVDAEGNINIEAVAGIDEMGLEQGVPFRRVLWQEEGWALPWHVEYLPDDSLFSSGNGPWGGREYRRALWIRRGQPARELTRCDGALDVSAVRLPDGLMPEDGIMQVIAPMNCDSLGQFPCGLNDTAIFHLLPSGEVRHTCQRIQAASAPVYWVQRPDGLHLAAGNGDGGEWCETTLSPPERKAVSTCKQDVLSPGTLGWVNYPPGHPKGAGAYLAYSYTSKTYLLNSQSFPANFYAHWEPVTGGQGDRWSTDSLTLPIQVGSRVAWLIANHTEQRMELAVLDPASASMTRREFALLDPFYRSRVEYTLATNGEALFALAARADLVGTRSAITRYWLRRVTEFDEELAR